MKFFRHHQRKIISILAGILALLMLLPLLATIVGTASATKTDEIKSEIGGLKSEYDKINSQRKDIAAQLKNLLVIKTGHIIMIQKIKLNFFPVNGAVNIHDKGFHAAGIHGGDDLKYTNGSHRKTSLKKLYESSNEKTNSAPKGQKAHIYTYYTHIEQNLQQNCYKAKS